MRINDVLKETQQVDELSLGGVGRGIEKGISGLSKATGYVAGIPQGIGKSFQKGKARAVAGLGGELPPTPAKPINPDFAKEYNRLTGEPPSSPTNSTNPDFSKEYNRLTGRQEPTLDPKAEDLAKQIKQKWAELSQLRDQYNKLTGGAAPAGAPAASSPASEPQSISAAPADQDMKDMAKLAGVPEPTAVSAAPADELEKASTASDASPAPAKQNRTSADDMEDEWNAAIADFKSQNAPAATSPAPSSATAAAPQAQPASNAPTAGDKKPEATPPSASDVPNPELDRLKQLSGQTPRETPTVDTTKMAAAPAAPTVPNTLTAKKETPAQTGIPKPTPSTTSAVKPGGSFQQAPNLGNVKMNAPAGIPKAPASTAATTKAAQDKKASQDAIKALTGRSVAVKEARNRK